ncbi:MAG: type II and III secretion system protein [Verrucomicrobiales bacterium]|nr:type II and III secretion system protein [Verrucomicrobiales bacterium]
MKNGTKVPFFCLAVLFLLATARLDVRAEGGAGGAVSGGVPGVAQKEVLKRQARVRQAQDLVQQADREYAEKNYREAVNLYVKAFQSLDTAPASASLREGVFQRYQTAVVKYARQLIDEGRLDAAEKLLSQAMTAARKSGMHAGAISPDLRKLLGQVKDDDYFNRARTPMHIKKVAEVDQLLKVAQGYLDLGSFDEATETYAKVIAVDPYNEAARRGMEQVDRLATNYAKAARNQTRAEMLQKVAQGWELPVPNQLRMSGAIVNPDVASMGNQAKAIQEKMDTIIIPSIEFEGARLGDVIDFLVQKAQELDVREPDPTKKGLNIVIDTGSGPSIKDQTVDIRLSHVPLGEVLRYVSARVGLKPRVEAYAVRLVALSDADETAMMTRRFKVPPGFIRGGGSGGGDAAASDDPFADDAGGGGGGTLVKRVTAKDFLSQNGVTFPQGSLAKFIPATATLMVRNTPANIEVIESMVIASRGEGAKVIKIDFRMIKVSENRLNELGFDWLLGAANVPGSNKTFFGGGTTGNGQAREASDFPFVPPGSMTPVGRNPVTAGNRSGRVKSTLSIDDVLESNLSSVGGASMAVAPGVFAVSGVFTDPQFQMVIRALDQKKGVDVLSEASVVTRSGDKAVIKQIREFIYPTEYDPPEIPNSTGNTTFIDVGTGATNTPDGFAVTPANPTAFEMRELGKILEVEPTLSADNMTVNLNIVTEVSDFIGFINYGTPIFNGDTLATANRILQPVFEATKETTSVTVWDGQTVAIGGLIGEISTKVEDKIPFLGDIPGIGRLFRSSIDERSRTAMVMFVTVRVLDPSGAPLNKAIAVSQ